MWLLSSMMDGGDNCEACATIVSEVKKLYFQFSAGVMPITPK